MSYQHAVVWLDHLNARIIKFDRNGFERIAVRSKFRHSHLHHKANSIGPGHAPVDRRFLQDISDALTDVKALLVAGPGLAKTEFVEFIREQVPELAKAIEGAENMDHPTDGELLKFARSYMHAADRMHR